MSKVGSIKHGCNSKLLSLRQGHLHYLHIKHVATEDLLKDLLQMEKPTKSQSNNKDITYLAECFEIYSSRLSIFH